MEKDNLRKLNNFFCDRKQENKKYQEKVNREKSEILKHVKFSGYKKEILKVKDNLNCSIDSLEVVFQPIDIKMLKNVLVDKYDVIFANFYDAIKGCFIELYQYIILIPKEQDVIPFVIIINTIFDRKDICNTNKKISIDKKLSFAIKRYVGMTDISFNIENITEIKKLSKTIKYDYEESVFNDNFIKKYINEYVANIKVTVHCDANEKLLIKSEDKDIDSFNINVARSIYNRFINKEIGEKYCNEVNITKESKIIIKCESVFDNILCEVEESENGKEIGYIFIREKVTKITITYLSGKVEKEVVLIAHKEIFKQGVLKDFLNN